MCPAHDPQLFKLARPCHTHAEVETVLLDSKTCAKIVYFFSVELAVAPVPSKEPQHLHFEGDSDDSS